VLAALGTVLLLTAAVGWLYLVRIVVAGWPGPQLPNALPLDVLAGHDRIPVLVYVVTFAVVGAVIGRCLRRLGRGGASTLAVIALGVWVTLYLFDVLSVFTVRQIPFVSSLGEAFSLLPAYLGAALVALVGWLTGARKDVPDRGGSG
jgi:hypothetical protein